MPYQIVFFFFEYFTFPLNGVQLLKATMPKFNFEMYGTRFFSFNFFQIIINILKISLRVMTAVKQNFSNLNFFYFRRRKLKRNQKPNKSKKKWTNHKKVIKWFFGWLQNRLSVLGTIVHREPTVESTKFCFI